MSSFDSKINLAATESALPELLPPQDQRFLRDVLGQFGTGVTVITTTDAHGKLIGLTANSFNSVSLSPPLVLWSQNCQSKNAPVFAGAEFFAVNILAAPQENIARQFASQVSDRFAGIEYALSTEGIPLLAGCCAWLICRSRHHYPAGDHVIHIGEILRCQQQTQVGSLLFHRGQFLMMDKL